MKTLSSLRPSILEPVWSSGHKNICAMQPDGKPPDSSSTAAHSVLNSGQITAESVSVTLVAWSLWQTPGPGCDEAYWLGSSRFRE